MLSPARGRQAGSLKVGLCVPQAVLSGSVPLYAAVGTAAVHTPGLSLASITIVSSIQPSVPLSPL